MKQTYQRAIKAAFGYLKRKSQGFGTWSSHLSFCSGYDRSRLCIKLIKTLDASQYWYLSCGWKYVRQIFMGKAIVSISPTLEGNRVIDSFHEFAGVKWLRDKPLSKFENSQWLLIQKAEEERLLHVKIKFLELGIDELKMACNTSYLKNSKGISTGLWAVK